MQMISGKPKKLYVPPRRMAANNGALLVIDRAMYVHDVSFSMQAFCRGSALVPNMALVGLLEMLTKAHITPPDWAEMLVAVGPNNTRNQDLLGSGLATK